MDRLSEIVMDLAEVVARLTHEEDVLAAPEGRAEAERLALEARRLISKDIRALSPVELLADRVPARVSATVTIREAANALVREGVGAVLVQGTLATAGIFTERDVVRAVSSGADPEVELAVHWMSRPVEAIDPKDTVLAAAEAMLAKHVRHLVLADGERVTGVVSARDVLACLLAEVRAR